MGLTNSVDKVDKDGRELLSYGTKDFPIAFFDDDLTMVKVPWHWHDELEIVIITEGTVNIHIANREFSLSAGDGYFANQGILHSATLETRTGHQHALVFDPRIIAHPDDLIWNTYVEPIIDSHSLPFIKLSSSVPWQKNIIKYSDHAWIQGAYERKDYPINVREQLTKVFAIISSNMELLQNESVYTDRFQKEELRIKKCLVFIENNYASSVTIDDIAKSADISVSSCLRLFNDVLGTTPIKYLLKYRLQKICEELENDPDASISRVVFSNGFSDATYFNRCFKKEYKMTPSEYIANINSLCKSLFPYSPDKHSSIYGR